MKKGFLFLTCLCALALSSCGKAKEDSKTCSVNVYDIDGEKLFSKDISFKEGDNLLTLLKDNTTVKTETSQYGEYIFSIANSIAIAVNAFSPPDKSNIFCNFFPGGCTSISIPLSSTFASSESFKLAYPPPKSSLNTSLKFSLILEN